MASVLPPVAEVRALYRQWIDAGRQPIETFARSIGRSSKTTRRWLTDYVVRMGIEATETRAALKGFAPDHDMTHPVPSPYVVKGTSTLYGDDGKAKLQWVKTSLDDRQVDIAMKAAIEALAMAVPRARAKPEPAHTLDYLCTLYTLTDSHVGMRAWAPETGAAWNLEIAESTLTRAIRYLVDASPAAETCVINQLGDFLHFDSLSPVTPTSGHVLDADCSYAQMVQAATRILRCVIDTALAKHARVVVLMAEGNHDIASSVWLRHLFGLLYENEPRVTVMQSELPYYVHTHGQTMLAFHHGHLSKNESLPLLFAAQYASDWGAAKHRYAHTGHRHHVDEREHNGMKVTQHATMAARDAYSARRGYVADRQIKAIVYHATYGETSTITCTPEMLEPA